MKIRKPTQAPHKFLCQFPPSQKLDHSAYTNYSQSQMEQSQKESKPVENIGNFIGGKKDNKNKPRYQGRFVKESIGDKHKVKPGEVFEKTWTYRNAGECAWPDDVLFIQTSGDDMGSIPLEID